MISGVLHEWMLVSEAAPEIVLHLGLRAWGFRIEELRYVGFCDAAMHIELKITISIVSSSLQRPPIRCVEVRTATVLTHHIRAYAEQIRSGR